MSYRLPEASKYAAKTGSAATAEMYRDPFDPNNWGASSSEFSSAEEAEDESYSLGSRITRTDIIYTTSQLAIMVETGISLSKALHNLSSQEQNPKLKQLLVEIKAGVESGEDFSTVLSKHSRYFDSTYISLVRASEKTGCLGEMLERISNYLRTDLETRGKVVGALAYPGIMLMIAIGVTIFLLTFIMPKFTPLFASRGTKLPMPTRVLMATSDFLINYWMIWSPALLLGIGVLIYFLRTTPGKRMRDHVLLHIPMLGKLMRKAILSRSIRTMATMIQSGVGMLESLKLTGEVAGNVFYKESWDRVTEQVTQGKKICAVLESDPLFPSTLVQMIASGEESGKLDVVLNKVSTYYDRELEISIKTTTSVLEPIMIVFMGVLVGGIAMSLMLPIFQLSRPGGH